MSTNATHESTTQQTQQTRIEADPNVPTIRIIRDFDAPPDKVFRASQPEELVVLDAASALYHRRLLTDPAALEYLGTPGGSSRSVIAPTGSATLPGDALLPYLRWRRLPLAPALGAGLLDAAGRECFAGSHRFARYPVRPIRLAHRSTVALRRRPRSGPRDPQVPLSARSKAPARASTRHAAPARSSPPRAPSICSRCACGATPQSRCSARTSALRSSTSYTRSTASIWHSIRTTQVSRQPFASRTNSDPVPYPSHSPTR